ELVHGRRPQGRAQAIRHQQGNDPFSAGQAPARRPRAEAGEGTDRGERPLSSMESILVTERPVTSAARSFPNCSPEMSGFMGRRPESAGAPRVARIAKHARRIVFLSNLTVRDGVEEQNYPVTTLHARIERLIE